MRATRYVALSLFVVLSLALLLHGTLPSVVTGSWTPANNLTEARSGSAAVVLDDGRILFTGGTGSTGPLTSAELFNTDGSISLAAPMLDPRSHHTAVVLKDGRVLVAGGTTSAGGVTNAAEIYDSASNSWVAVPGGMTSPRSDHTASRLNDGSVLLAGGATTAGASNTLEIYSPDTNSFTAVTSGTLSSARQDHAAAVLADGRVLIAGGSDGSTSLSSSDIFDPAAGSVSAGPAMASARAGLSATTLLDGKVLLAGGNDGSTDVGVAEVYDPSTGTISATGGLATPRRDHLAFLLPHNNGVLIAGGSSAGAPLASAELFFSWTGAFTATGAMASPRTAAAGAALKQDGYLLVAGGSDGTNPLASTELYGFATVKTDKADYAPGETVTISGSGWQPGETVTLSLLESPLLDTHGPFTATADSFGNISNVDFVPDEHDVNVLFYLTATGSVSQAQTTFADSKPNTVTVGTQSTNPVAPGSLTAYTVTVNFNGNGNSCTSPLSVSTLLPAGVTASFSPSSVTSTGGDVNSTLTLSTTNATPPGSTNFTVLAANGGGTCQSGTASGNGALIVVEPTTTTLTSSVNPSTFGQSTTLTATVAQTSGPTTPNTGTVTFKDGTTALGMGTLNASGVATLAVSTLTTGSHSLTASYAGTALFGASTSNTVSQTVNQASTSTTVTSSQNPSVFGQSVTFTATVAAVSPGSGTATGTVTFKDGAATIGTGTLNGSGQATLTTTTLAVGPHSITAVYGADTNFTGSTSSILTQTVNQADTTTTVTSATNPSVFGQSVTFTATVAAAAPGAGTPTGTVTFKDGATTLGTGTLNGSGQATFATSSLSVSGHSITAVYGSDTNFKTSTSAILTQTVNQASTTTTVSSATNPSTFGQSVTFTATVAAVAPGAGTPTGTVTFKDGATTLGTGTLDGSAQATFLTSSLTAGSHSITAVYGSDPSFNTSTSAALTQTVNKANTTTSVSTSGTPTVFGQSVTFTATVAAVLPATGTPTGAVTFKDGAATLGTGTLNGSGVATFSTTTLSVTGSPHSITAVYGNDTNFNGSTSTAVTQNVGPASTTTALTSSVNPSVFGQSVTFTATVTAVAPGTGTPTGTVTFKDGTTTLGTGTLNGSGVASFSTTTLSVAGSPHGVTAVYATDGNFATSTSPSVSQLVNQASTTTALTSSANPSVFGQTVTFTATVAAVAPGSGTPTGTVTFKDGGSTIGTGTLNGAGVATFGMSSLSVASHPITAVYGSDTNFNGSTSAPLSQVVNKANTSTVVTSSVNPSTYGQSVTFTATVTAVAPGAGTPTGSAQFFDGATSLGTGTLNGSGVATITTSALSAGPHNAITAVFTSGDGNFNGSTSPVFSQTVSMADSSTTLASSLNPSLFGQSVTFTATVTYGSPAVLAASGCVTFMDGGTTLASNVALVSGLATFTTTSLTAGSHGIQANFKDQGTGCNAGNNLKNSNASLTQIVNQAPAITSANNTTFTVGVAGSFTVTATGFPAPTLSETGTLPSGVTFNSSTGVLSGSPAAGTGGAYAITFTAANGVGTNATQNFTLNVNQTSAITSANSTTFTAGTLGSFTVTTTGFPKPSLTKSGSLPSGVTFTDNGNGTASLSGTATSAGSFPITITAQNGVGANATQIFTLTVNPGAIDHLTLSPLSATIFAGGSQAYTATGFDQYGNSLGDVTGTTTFSITPDGGCTLNSCSATVAGGHTVTGTKSGKTGTASLSVNPGPTATLALSPASATIAAGASQSYTAQGVDSYGNLTGDVTGSTAFSIAPDGSCTGANCTANIAGPHTVTGNYSGKTGMATLTVTAGAFVKLQLLVPGETAAPGTVSGKTGTPQTEYVNGAFNVTVNAVDANWNVVSSVTDTVQITSNDARAHLPSNAPLALGTGTFSVTLVTESHDPATTTLTASDVTDGTKASDTSPAITVIVAYTASISPSAASDGASTAYTLTVNNAGAPNTNTLRSVTVATPANGGTPSLVSVTAANPGPTPANWSVDLSQLPGYLRFTQNSPTDGVGPGGTISIQFTTTANESITTAVVQEVWTTTAFSNNDYTGPLPLAGSEPTVTIGKAPVITSANSASFTVGVAGNFTVTTTGVPKSVLSQTGTLPNGVTFTDNHDGTGTLSGTPASGTAGTYGISFKAANGIPPDATQSFTLTVINPATTTAVASSPNPSTYGQSVTFTASVTSGSGTPTGSVTFYDSATCSGAVLAAWVGLDGSGKASFTRASLSTPSHTITACYTPTGIYLASNGSVTQTVNPASTTTAISAPTVTYNANGSVTVTVISTAGPVTGNVSLSVDGATATTQPLAGGSSTFTLTSPNAGDHSLSASYAAQGNFAASSTTGTLHVNQATTTTTISAPTVIYPADGIVTVTVSSGAGTPTGSASLVVDGGAPLLAVLNGGGVATFTLASPSPGVHTLSASYAAQGNFAASGPAPGTLTVYQAPSITSAASAMFTAAVPGTFTLTTMGFPTPSLSATGALPSGVTFTDNGNGTATLAGTATVAGSYPLTITAHNLVSNAVQLFTLTLNPGPFAKLQLLVPGETAVPGTVSGKTGTPNTEYVNGAFNVTVNAVDDNWNLVNTVTDTVHFTSTDTSAVLPSNAALVAGTGAFSVTLVTPESPAATTITASDVTDNTKASDTSPAIEVIVVYTASISPTMVATGDSVGYTLTVTNDAAPNTNTLRSVTVAMPANGGTPSLVSVTAANPGPTPANWSVDLSHLPSYLRFTQNTPTDGVLPGGTISIQFTATATNAINNALEQNVWMTTAFSDDGSTSALPLAGTEPTVSIGARPAITSANHTTNEFTYGAAGTFTVTSTGFPTPGLSESGALPGGVTFADNHDGTATISGTPTAAGTITLTITAHNGYGSDATQTFTLTVNKANATISVTPYHVPYDGNPHTATGSATGVKGESLSGLDLTHTTHTNAGTYSTDYWSFTDSTGNYNNVANTTITDIIDKVNATITVTGYNVTYDGNPHTATGTATGVGGADLSSYLNLSGTTHTNAGTYSSDAWSFAGGTNYNDASGTVNDVIKKATATISVTPYSVTYDGNPHTATWTATGVKSESLSGLELSGTTHTNAGTTTDTWTFTDVTGNYYNATGTVSDVIKKATPVIMWANPADIFYGTALSGTQLNATFTWVVNGSTVAVPGTATYTPPSGTVLNTANGQNLKVDFTPTDTNNYYTATKMVQINVLKATPTVTWTNPADIFYGTALSGTQLNATFTWVVNGSTVTVPGTATYTPLGGTVLNAGNNQNLHVYFTPADTTNYNGTSKDVKINVQPAPLIITASTGAMTYGGSPYVVVPIPSGFVPGEGLGNLPTLPVCLPVFTTTTPAGPYPSSCSGPALDGNYSVTYMLGSVMVNQASTSTMVASSPNPSNWMDVVTLTATVSSPGSTVAPTGSVAFYNAANGATCASPVSSTLLNTVLLATTGSNQQASTSTANLPVGTDTILACYNANNADSNYNANFISSSGTTTQTVNPAPIASLTPPDMSFGNQQAGTTSNAQTVTLSNANGTATLHLSIGFTGTTPTWFTQTNTCGSAIAAGASCAIYVKFAPPLNSTGVGSAFLTVTDDSRNVPGSTQMTSLTGAGLTSISDQSLYTNAIFATAATCGSITLSGGSTVDSFNSTAGYNASHQNSGGNVGTNGNVTLSGGKSAIYGIVSSPIPGTGNCNKTSTTGLSTSGGAQTSGLQQLSGPLNYPAPPVPSPAPPTTTQNISGSCPSGLAGCTNTANKTVTLAPGQYGNLTLSGGTTAHVSMGTYNINSLKLSGNSILHVDSGPVVINLAAASLSGANQAMDASGGSLENTTYIPSNLQFTYAGSRGVTLSGGSNAYATVYAPNALVNFSGGSDFFGSVIGSTITNSGNTSVHYDANLPLIRSGKTIWFNAEVNNVNLNNLTSQVKLYMTNSSVSFAPISGMCPTGTTGDDPQTPTVCTLAVPNAVIIFNSASVTSGATTSYDSTNKRWVTNVAKSALAFGNSTFVGGIAYPVPIDLPSGIQNVSWSAAFSSDAPTNPGISFQWHWGAAVYNQFGAFSSLGVNPEDGSYNAHSPDSAGTPELFKQYITFGGTGGGLSSYTGYPSTNSGIVPTLAPMSVSPSSDDAGPVAAGNSQTMGPYVLTNNSAVSHSISSLSIVGTNQLDFTILTNTCPVGGALAAGGNCSITVKFAPTGTSGTGESAKIVINDDAPNSPQTVYLTGTVQ